MLPACFQLADQVFPRVRGQTARRLVAAGWSQSRAAEAIGVSQAMVSKYAAQDPDEDPLVLRLADDLATRLQTGDVAPDSWCATLPAALDDGSGALEDLLRAERMVLTDAPLRVMPQIGLNLARALPGADGPDGVLAYPGRLVEAGGRIVRPSPPVPGGSRHLARCLLTLHAQDPDVTAIANVRGGDVVRDAAEALGWAPQDLPPGDDVDTRFAAAADGTTRALHDPGAVGIEPCLYIAGPDAVSVARRILTLHDKVTP